MSGFAYRWRDLSQAERAALVESRRSLRRPWHSPPHFATDGAAEYLLTAACAEHRPYIGLDPARMDAFSATLLDTVAIRCPRVPAWCVLPNHYHVLIETTDLPGVAADLGRMHGRLSHAWNGEECARGRRVFYRVADRLMRSEAHRWVTINYVHANPVRHGYVARSPEWPWCSAAAFVESVGAGEAARIWREYPVRDYGAGGTIRTCESAGAGCVGLHVGVAAGGERPG